MGLINVDCDGVLVPNVHEDTLFSKVRNEGYSFADTSQIFDWYTELVETKPLDVNHHVMGFLQRKKEEGHAIRLWTNRMYTLRNATIRNLGDYKSIFDSFEFHSGRKHLSQVEGTVIDNSEKYLHCGESGIHYEWR
jgi:hypothetical protein